MTKLTPAQLDVLRDAKAGKVWRSESAFPVLYQSCDDNRTGRQHVVTPIVGRLTAMQPPLLKLGEPYQLRRTWHVTEAGDKLLAEHDRSEED